MKQKRILNLLNQSIWFLPACLVPMLTLALSPAWYGDILHNIWTFGDLVRRVWTAPYDANIYFPQTYGIVQQEVQILNTILFSPFYYAELFFAGYVFIYFLNIMLTSVAIWLLARQVGATQYWATLAGMSFPVVSYSLNHAPHVQLLNIWLPLLVIVNMATVKNRINTNVDRGKGSLNLFLLLLLALAGPSYTGILAATLFLCYLATSLINSRMRSWRYIRTCCLLAIAAFLIDVPILYPFALAFVNGLSRSSGEGFESRADLSNYFQPFGHWLYGPTMEHYGLHYDVSQIFPGYLLLIFCTVGILSIPIIIKKLQEHAPNQSNNDLIFVYWTGIVCFFISLGPTITFHSQPLTRNPVYFFFFDIFPILRATRFTGFYGGIALVMFLVIAARAFSFFTAKMNLRITQNVVFARTLLILTFSFIVLENIGDRQVNLFRAAIHAPDRLSTGAPPPELVYHDLKKYPNGPTISLPINNEKEYLYMYYSLQHNNRILNGHSGFPPGHWRWLKSATATFPSLEAISALRNSWVRYIVTHDGIAGNNCKRAPSLLKVLSQHGDTCLFEITDEVAVEPGTKYSFTTGGNGHFLAALKDPQPAWSDQSGWSEPEPWGTWSTGPTSYLNIPIDPDHEITLRFRMAAYLPPIRASNTIRISINGRLIEEWNLTKPDIQTYELFVPRDLTNEKLLRLEFRYADYRSPYELKLGQERRRIAIGLSSLEVAREN